MRITSAVAAGSLIVALSSPFAWAQGPVEQLLIDVNELHATYTDTLDAQLDDIRAAEEAEDEDALVEAQDAYRATLKEWRIDLIDAADELAELREGAESKADAPTSDADGSDSRSTATSLSKQERKAFEEAEDAIEQDRATVRELRADVLGDDEAIYLPSVLGNAEEPGALGGLGGLLGTTASDAIERSEQGDKRIVFGLPESDEHAGTDVDAAPRTEVKAPSEPTSERTTPETTETDAASAEDAATSAEDSAPRPYYRAEVMQDNDEDSTTESSTATSTETTTSSSADETTTGTGTSESSSAAETTTGTTTSGSSSSETTSATAILQNRTTSASSSSSSSTVTRTTSSTRTTVDDDDEEETRDGDLAETGTPMRSLLVLAALLTLAGVFLVRRPA